ncbi:MAG: restriction endonuclease subunit S [Synergistaceae bacterium]
MCQYVFGYVNVKLSDIATITRGVRVVKKQLSNNGEYPVYQNSLLPMGYYDKCNCDGESTYVISAGAAGEIGYCKDSFWAADDCFVFSNLHGVINKFLYYYLLSRQNYIRQNVRTASIPRLSRTVIEKLQIELPPLDEQKRIVALLDRFDTLCNDISTGLPAEIEARQKQYEYYRDKLLSFEKL